MSMEKEFLAHESGFEDGLDGYEAFCQGFNREEKPERRRKYEAYENVHLLDDQDISEKLFVYPRGEITKKLNDGQTFVMKLKEGAVVLYEGVEEEGVFYEAYVDLNDAIADAREEQYSNSCDAGIVMDYNIDTCISLAEHAISLALSGSKLRP